jgi:hypothetical protein
MQTDPTTYILAASILGFVIGFFAAAIAASHRIRRSEIDGWKAGVRFYQDRETESRAPRL